jgi:hypothetical protein
LVSARARSAFFFFFLEQEDRNLETAGEGCIA